MIGTDKSERIVCRADVDLAAIGANLAFIRQKFPVAAPVCMVKANAYGHGAAQVATYLESCGVGWFGVATVDEGIELRNAKITGRILVMSGAGAQFVVPELLKYGLTPLVSSYQEIDALAAEVGQTPLKIHLDFDTGMTRGGLLELDPKRIADSCGRLEIEGMSTHFASAEDEECSFSNRQMDAFLGFIGQAVGAGIPPRYLHLDKSTSILSGTSSSFRESAKKLIPDIHFLMRPGLSLYGIDGTNKRLSASKLKPALSWRAPIVLRKKIGAGIPIGYNSTFVTTKETEIALVRVGYADGLKRQLSSLGFMLVNGIRAPIVGRVSMDLTTIDVTEVVNSGAAADCEVGRFTTIIGLSEQTSQTACDLAELCDTIPYEILTSISLRVQRSYDEKRPFRA